MTVSVLFVCLGNICRSPTAEAVFRARVQAAGLEEQILIDSAGTGDWHIGKAPDARAQAAASSRGYTMADLRARRVGPEDFHRFDYILAMDDANYSDLEAMAPAEGKASLNYFLSFADNAPRLTVPDPYYGGEDGFGEVLDLVESAADGLLRVLQERL